MKFLAYELFEIEADTQEAAQSSIELSSDRNSVIYVGTYLGDLYHPVHLQAAQDKFGYMQPVVPVEVVDAGVAHDEPVVE